jgi:polyhydroxyalkanoate synthesis regulator phasin
MKEMIKKSFLLGLGAVTLTKNQAEKLVKELVKKNAVTSKEGKALLVKAKNAAKNEAKRIKKFAQQEAKRVVGGLGGVSKTQLIKVKKKLQSIDKELSSKGKQTLKRIMKELK